MLDDRNEWTHEEDMEVRDALLGWKDPDAATCMRIMTGSWRDLSAVLSVFITLECNTSCSGPGMEYERSRRGRRGLGLVRRPAR